MLIPQLLNKVIFWAISCFSLNIPGEAGKAIDLPVIKDTVNVNSLNCMSNAHLNQTKKLQWIINNNQQKVILLPTKQIFIVDSLKIPSETTLTINGILIKSSGSNGPLLIFRNVKNVSLTGSGILNGNKKHQKEYRDANGLVYVQKVNGFTIKGLLLKDNYFPRYTNTAYSGAMIYVEASINLKFSNLIIRNYAREGIWIRSSSRVELNKVDLYGGYDSWTGLQCGTGTNSIVADSILSRNAGATGINMDVVNGILKNSRVFNNTYFHGFSFGHEGFPANNVTVQNCTYALEKNINKTDLKSKSANGFNVSAGSDNIKFINCSSEGAKQNGFNISNGSKYVILENCNAKASSVSDVNVYGDNKTKVLLLKSKFHTNRIKRSANAQVIRKD